MIYSNFKEFGASFSETELPRKDRSPTLSRGLLAFFLRETLLPQLAFGEWLALVAASVISGTAYHLIFYEFSRIDIAQFAIMGGIVACLYIVFLRQQGAYSIDKMAERGRHLTPHIK